MKIENVLWILRNSIKSILGYKKSVIEYNIIDDEQRQQRFNTHQYQMTPLREKQYMVHMILKEWKTKNHAEWCGFYRSMYKFLFWRKNNPVLKATLSRWANNDEILYYKHDQYKMITMMAKRWQSSERKYAFLLLLHVFYSFTHTFFFLSSHDWHLFIFSSYPVEAR